MQISEGNCQQTGDIKYRPVVNPTETLRDRTRIFQDVLTLTKENNRMQWHVRNRAKVFLCKKAGGEYPCDLHGINLFVQIIKSSDQTIIFSGEVASNFNRKFNYDIDVIISVDTERVGPDGAAMYVHLEEQ
ncbi:hypothetical protein [Peribacillus asahii]|uniref:hypothetical protein n=1 Tax=Peribacillus asahii TaxID=228899 RepID=UPI002079AB9B|nr:hypothetical protein [Peribacillus asahii]USK83590.1 hypothetical protein LIT35_14125 [Peribacillus asahii]